jgi:hypothetical protein
VLAGVVVANLAGIGNFSTGKAELVIGEPNRLLLACQRRVIERRVVLIGSSLLPLSLRRAILGAW